MRSTGAGMPTAVSISIARAVAARLETSLWRLTASVSWSPILCTGFSDVIGSWKIIAASLPRTWRSSDFDRCSRSRPSSIAVPVIRTFFPRQETHQGQVRDGLAGARLADDAEHLAAVDGERDVVDRADRTVVGDEASWRGR